MNVEDEAREYFEHARKELGPKMRSSAAIVAMDPGKEIDPKQAMEIGYALLLGKPIITVGIVGQPVNDALRRASARVVELSGPLNSLVGQAELQAALVDVIGIEEAD